MADILPIFMRQGQQQVFQQDIAAVATNTQFVSANILNHVFICQLVPSVEDTLPIFIRQGPQQVLQQDIVAIPTNTQVVSADILNHVIPPGTLSMLPQTMTSSYVNQYQAICPLKLKHRSLSLDQQPLCYPCLSTTLPTLSPPTVHQLQILPSLVKTYHKPLCM